MAAVAVEAIGFVFAGAIGLVPVLQSFFEPKKDQTTVVKIILVESLGDLSASLSGNVPGVALWDELGRSIGTTPGTSEILPQGNFVNINVVANPEVGNVRPSYISISNGGNDAICVAGLTITFPDDTKVAWNGDVGSICGAQFFESTREFNENHATPKCIWIDRDGSLGLKYQGFGFHIGDFFGNKAQADSYNNNSELLCKSGPRFRMYEKLRAEDPILTFKPPLEYNDDRTDKDPSKVIENPGVFADQDQDALRKVCTNERQCKELTAERCGLFRPSGGGRSPGICFGRMQERDVDVEMVTNRTLAAPKSRSATSLQQPQSGSGNTRPFKESLVISALPGHSAKLLCNSENSWGPSFVSTAENLFCEMESKTLYDVCSKNQSSCCFDMDQNQIRPCFSERARRGRIQRKTIDESRIYTKVRKWVMD